MLLAVGAIFCFAERVSFKPKLIAAFEDFTSVSMFVLVNALEAPNWNRVEFDFVVVGGGASLLTFA